MATGREGYIERLHACGIEAAGRTTSEARGCSRGAGKVAQKQLQAAIVAAEARLPAVSADDFPAALLGRAVLAGLRRLEEIVSVPVDEATMREQPKMARLIGDTALGVVKLGLRAQEGAMRGQRDPESGGAAGRNSGQQGARPQGGPNDKVKPRPVITSDGFGRAGSTLPPVPPSRREWLLLPPEATFRETAAPAWLEINVRHARVMSAVARAAWSGWPRRCVKLT